jgi:hypothetical protein
MFFSPWLVLSYIFSRRPCGSILKLAATVFEETPELLDDEVLKIFLFSIDSGERSMFLLRTEWVEVVDVPAPNVPEAFLEDVECIFFDVLVPDVDGAFEFFEAEALFSFFFDELYFLFEISKESA